MFQRVGIIARKSNDAVKQALDSVIALLERLSIAVAVDEGSADLVAGNAIDVVPTAMIGINRDLVVAIGGDGTLLHAAQKVFVHDVPLAGINLGRVGFLTDLSPDQIESDLAAILRGDYTTEERIFLDCEAIRDDKVHLQTSALNDVVVQKWNTARLITFDTFINDRFVHTQRADGLIVATPTGSTAYALAGGGPILHPSVPAMVMVPICPHTLTNRPIVVNDSVVIDIKLATSRHDDAQLSCDGNDVFLLAPGDRVRIRRNDRTIRLIHPANHDHYAILRAKLHWGRDLC